MSQQKLTPASLISMLLSGFPTSQGTDPDMQMTAFAIACEGARIEAMKAAVKAYIQGKVKRDNHTFAPSAAEFAEQVKAEQARIDALNRQPALPPAPHHKEFVDHVNRQRRETTELERQGYRKLADNIGQEEMNTLSKRRRFPAGTVWKWALQEAWSKPETSA